MTNNVNKTLQNSPGATNANKRAQRPITNKEKADNLEIGETIDFGTIFGISYQAWIRLDNNKYYESVDKCLT